MNRRARRRARSAVRHGRSMCLAAYPADGGAVIHAPADCDGTCGAERWRPSPAVAAAWVLPLWMWLTQEVMPAPEGSDFGLTREMLRELALMARNDRVKARGRALAALRVRYLRRFRGCQLGAALQARGLIGTRRDDGRPGLSVRVAVKCCPHTGPPVALACPAAGMAALGAPVISP